MKRLLLFLLFPLVTFGQAWNGLIPAGSGIDWTQVGIWGPSNSGYVGIPTTRTQCGTTITPIGGGTSDVSQIQTALNNCASAHPLTASSPGDGGYVLLGNGTFTIDAFITLKNNTTIRGSGPRNTVLNVTIGGSGAVLPFQVGNTSAASGTFTTITAGATQGSTSITVSGGTIPTVGQLLLIDEIDPAWVDLKGCNWCNVFMQGTTGQIVEVLTSGGGTVTFRPPLYFNYQPNSPRGHPYNVGVKYAGIEYLQTFANNNTVACTNGGAYYCGVEYFSGAEYSWVKGVEHNFADGAHELIRWSLGVEVRDSFFHDGFDHSSVLQNDDEISLNSFSSANLIENNILFRQHSSIHNKWATSGNVIAYNYIDNNYATDTSPGSPWMQYDTGDHGATPMFILYEGNIGNKLQPDDVHGSSAYVTMFRNYYKGSRLYTPPSNSRGALVHTGSPSACAANTFTVECWEDSTQGLRAFSIDVVDEFCNLVGNIAGSAHMAGLSPYGIIAPSGSLPGVTIQSTQNLPAAIAIGYNGGQSGAGSTTGTGCPGGTCGSPATTYLHGNYNFVSQTFQWTNGVTHTLPASFYRSSPPAYWGTHAWPPIGPDVVSGATGWNGAGYVSTIPALDCFNNASLDANGYPLFDPVACYPVTNPGNNNPGVAVPTILIARAN